MRALAPEWQELLPNPRARKVLLVTVVFSRDALTAAPHPAMLPGALRIGTRFASVTGPDGKDYPFFPALTQWPALTREWVPQTRRAPVAKGTFEIAPLVQFPRRPIVPGQPPSAWVRVDVWTPGVRLDRAIQWIAGPIVDGDFERPTSGVTISMEDGDTRRSIQFPPGKRVLDVDDFPDVPDLVAGRARRQTIFGPFPDPIPCWPISRDGRRYYLCEPACSVPPFRFQKGGVEISGRDRPIVTIGRMASDPSQTYTELVFPGDVGNIPLVGDISASGGVGLATDAAPITLLRDIGGYELSQEAELLLTRASKQFNFSVYFNASGDVLKFVSDRILPQTDLVLAQHLNKIDVIPLLANTARVRMGLGQGFWRRVPTRRRLTHDSDVWNVIVVNYRRTIVPLDNGTLMRNSFVVDKTYGGPIGALLAMSEELYGRRTLTLDAADLIESTDGGLPLGVVTLGEKTALLTAMPHQQYGYDANWDRIQLTLNDQVLLDDEVEGLEAAPTRVVSESLLPTGPQYLLQTEDRTV